MIDTFFLDSVHVCRMLLLDFRYGQFLGYYDPTGSKIDEFYKDDHRVSVASRDGIVEQILIYKDGEFFDVRPPKERTMT